MPEGRTKTPVRGAVGLLLAGWLVAVASAADGPPPAEAYRGADPVLLELVRGRFKAATESGKTTVELIARMDGALPADPAEWPAIFRAYRASLEGLTGKHSRKPWEKYTRVKAGLARFHGLVEAHPESIEIRALRYAFCSQLPGLFEVGPLAEMDLVALADQLERGADPTVTPAYCREVAAWILQNGNPAPEQRRKLQARAAAWD